MEYHEAADIFPKDDSHIEELAADIKKNGQQIPIELLDGEILDGRCRYEACQKLGVEAIFKDVKVGNPVSYVLSLNLSRRHLEPQQRAMIVQRGRELADASAKDRHAKLSGRPPKNKPPDRDPEVSRGDARDEIAKAGKVSGRSVDRAAVIQKKGIPELIQAVDDGKLKLRPAERIAREPKESQKRLLESELAPKPKPKRKRKKKSVTPADHIPEVGLDLAHRAINTLKEISPSDRFWKRGFEIVREYVEDVMEATA